MDTPAASQRRDRCRPPRWPGGCISLRPWSVVPPHVRLRRAAAISAGVSRCGSVSRVTKIVRCIIPKAASQSAMRSGKMISRLDRYIFRQILVAMVVTPGGLTALVWLTQSLRFVDLVVNRGLSFFVFLHLTGLLIPSFIAVILPITTYVVIQFAYQRMATDRELTVMRAAGLSPWALARPALAVEVLTPHAGSAH